MPEPESDGRGRLLKRGAKLANTIAQDIVRRIQEEDLAPGTQLPSEAQMVADYGVGRASLREALRILEFHGLISIRSGPGGGPVVGGVNTEDFGRMSTLYFQAGRMTFRELMEARLILEPVLARMAAERRDPELLDQLLEAGAHRGSSPRDDGVYLESSRDFHRLLAQMAGNSILYLFSHSLQDILHDRVRSMLFPVSRRREVFDAHAAIAQAVADGDPGRAEEFMREHMTQYAKYVKRRYPALWNEVVDWR